jgi:carbonic anhydrase
MPKLIEVNSEADILPKYRDTPIERLLRHQNLGEPLPPGSGPPQVFVSMCIDNRKSLNVPHGFAYVMRTAGARLQGNEFELTFAIAIGRVSAVALIGHTDCGMEKVLNLRESFIEGLAERGGVNPEAAAAHFDASAPRYAISSSLGSIVLQAEAVGRLLPKILVAPLLYRVEDDRLAQIHFETATL